MVSYIKNKNPKEFLINKILFPIRFLRLVKSLNPLQISPLQSNNIIFRMRYVNRECGIIEGNGLCRIRKQSDQTARDINLIVKTGC